MGTMKRPSRSVLIVTSAVAVCLLVLGFGGLAWASGLQSAAAAAKSEAKAGASSLAAQDATAAVSHFRAAAKGFSAVRSSLGPEWVGGLVRAVPWVGRQYVATRSLATIGADVSGAGAELALALAESSSTAVPTGSTRFGVLLSVGRVHIDTALTLLGDAADRIAGLDETGLHPRLVTAIHELQGEISAVAPFLDRSRSLLALERFMLSAPRRILVVSQNSAELRPTGGFTGSYGILDVGPQGFKLDTYTDVYRLPDPPGRVVPPPGARMTNDFGFRDANWWIDFPTSAKAMLGFWRGYGQPNVDGIVALDVVAVKDLLGVFGPVYVASYDETFTADNLLDRLLYLIEVKSGGSPTKKDVLVALAEELQTRMLSGSPQEMAGAALVLARAADAKHIQFYFEDAAAEAAVARIGWSGSIAPPSGATDVLAVSNAMTRPGKVNIAVRKAISYQVGLQANGAAETTLVLDYSNSATAQFAISSSSTFRDYLRVYRKPGTTLSLSTGAAPSLNATVEAGVPVIVHEFLLKRGATHRETILTRVPGAWEPGSAPVLPRPPARNAATQTGAGLTHYRLFVVRQADLQDVPITVIVTPPAGWRILGVEAWSAASSAKLPTSFDAVAARLTAPLAGDEIMDVLMGPE